MTTNSGHTFYTMSNDREVSPDSQWYCPK